MNTQVGMGAATSVPSRAGSAPANASVWMTCEICDLAGGPFSVAEAAHLRAIHDRLHHGVLTAAA